MQERTIVMNGLAMTGKKLIFKNVFILPKLSIIYPYAKTENDSPLFFGSIIDNINKKRRTEYSARRFLRLQLYCHNSFKVECSLQNYKKSTTFFKYETKIQFLHSLPLHQMYAYNRKSNCKTLTKWDRILFHPVCILFSLFHQQHPNIHDIQ